MNEPAARAQKRLQMDLKQAILDWIAKREAAVRAAAPPEGSTRHGGPCRLPEAHSESEERLSQAIAALDPRDASPLSEAARLWQAAKRVSRFTESWGPHGTGPCPEIASALQAAEGVLHVLVSGNPGARREDSHGTLYFHARRPDHPGDASFEFVDRNRDTWVVRDCEEDPGCTVIERLHSHEIERANRAGEDPEPVQVVDVPPDLCGLVGHALVARAGRVNDQKRRSG